MHNSTFPNCVSPLCWGMAPGLSALEQSALKQTIFCRLPQFWHQYFWKPATPYIVYNTILEECHYYSLLSSLYCSCCYHNIAFTHTCRIIAETMCSNKLYKLTIEVQRYNIQFEPLHWYPNAMLGWDNMFKWMICSPKALMLKLRNKISRDTRANCIFTFGQNSQII